jgi:hypothetical protein
MKTKKELQKENKELKESLKDIIRQVEYPQRSLSDRNGIMIQKPILKIKILDLVS